MLTLMAIQPGSSSTTYGLAGLAVSAALTAEATLWQTASASLSHAVQNNMHFYKLTVLLNQNSSATALLGARITYTVAQPE